MEEMRLSMSSRDWGCVLRERRGEDWASWAVSQCCSAMSVIGGVLVLQKHLRDSVDCY